MSTMFGGAGGATPASWSLTGDMLKKNQEEQDRLTGRANEVNALADAAGVSAKMLGESADRRRQQQIANPSPWMATGYTGVAGYGGGRTLGTPAVLGMATGAVDY